MPIIVAPQPNQSPALQKLLNTSYSNAGDFCNMKQPDSDGGCNIESGKHIRLRRKHVARDFCSPASRKLRSRLVDIFSPIHGHNNIFGSRGDSVFSKLPLDTSFWKSSRSTHLAPINARNTVGDILAYISCVMASEWQRIQRNATWNKSTNQFDWSAQATAIESISARAPADRNNWVLVLIENRLPWETTVQIRLIALFD